MHMQKVPVKLSGSQTRKPTKVGKGVLERCVLSGISMGWGGEHEDDLGLLCAIVKLSKNFRRNLEPMEPMC